MPLKEVEALCGDQVAVRLHDGNKLEAGGVATETKSVNVGQEVAETSTNDDDKRKRNQQVVTTPTRGSYFLKQEFCEEEIQFCCKV